MAQNQPIDPLFCPTETALGLIGGKWKGMILWCICRKTMRFNELHRIIPDISQRMLTKQLRELEDHKIIVRKVYPQIPPKVEYSLSTHGEALKPILDQLEDWSRSYLEQRQAES
ncbi:winged helix-turn-helix transcriptional regulator [Roseibium alexandrii]|jgi:DNA-binding HxlR family transcriptional regulator|uniref:HTH-type transcriptional activator HxlR n=2 Tax=Roseibium alexandrii TaxID=388408 RepID=A0A0M7AE84_9HYPH|nr:helix-turn-helix domain-containing protein [Roseibium alexandrii]EEE47273.1 putative transcriptional regulator [Roseibium alexandrii DFL-11]CTQ72941.1 HTH-type transcriptional activator HxlR [Roseibium alexandrii]